MPTSAEEISLIYNTVLKLNQTADGAYGQARADLASLSAAVEALPLTRVNVDDIGATAGVSWSAAGTLPAMPVESALDEDLPPTPDLPAVLIPAAVRVDDLAAWTVDLSGRPGALAGHTLAGLPPLGSLPEIVAVAPTLDVGLLQTEFDFNEPAYTERLTPTVQAELLRVLGGDLGIPQAYWDGLWAQTASDLAGQAAAAARTARNRGAASHWGLPGETVLAAARVAQDAVAKALQEARLKQAQAQAEMARADFWQAVERALGFEQVFINAHQQVAARALTACEQLHQLRVAVHNAGIARFNARLEAARLEGALADLRVQRVLKEHGQRLALVSADIEQDKTRIARWQAQWAAYQTDTGAAIAAAAEQIKRFTGQVDAHARYEALKQQRAGVDVERYKARLGRVASLAQATAALLSARTAAAEYGVRAETLALSRDQVRNAAALDIARLTQAAQETRARLDIAQAQWINGQGLGMVQRMAELSWSFAQACMQVADVSYGRDVNLNISASQNQDLKW